MKRFLSVLLVPFLLVLLVLPAAGCESGGARAKPVGTFSFGSDTFTIGSNGSFLLSHEASAEYRKNYVVIGTCTWTLDQTDDDNEISLGKIDITVTKLMLDGASVSTLDFTNIHQGDDAAIGDKLLGWWRFMNLKTVGGRMELGFNLASKGYRPEDPYTGRDVLVFGDPK
jgi:hypothetical protein